MNQTAQHYTDQARIAQYDQALGIEQSIVAAQKARILELEAALSEIASCPSAETLAETRKSGSHNAYTIAGIARAILAKKVPE